MGKILALSIKVLRLPTIEAYEIDGLPGASAAELLVAIAESSVISRVIGHETKIVFTWTLNQNSTTATIC